MPEARLLVTDGPYKTVRHPLYLCELTILVAMVLQYRSWAAAALFALIAGIEILRAKFEETVLAQSFPEFETYRARSGFLFSRRPLAFFTQFFADRRVMPRMAIALATALGLLGLVLALPKF
jgi:hypothetical protein